MRQLSTIPGLVPLPDWTKEELTDRKGRQKDDLIDGNEGSEIESIYHRARTEIVAVQHDAGLDRIGEGQLRWDDMLCHPLAVHNAVDTGGLRRYYDNNNFYREVTVVEELDRDGDVGRELDAIVEDVPPDRRQATLPGPYSLAELSSDAYYGDEDAFLEGLATFLVGEIKLFPEISTLFLLDPSLATNPPSDIPNIIDAYEFVVDTARQAGIDDIIVHTYWGIPPASIYASLLDIPGCAIGLDVVTDSNAGRALIHEIGVPETLCLGLIDAQNTSIESPEEINTRISDMLNSADLPETLYLSSNTELFYLPERIANEKLALLGSIAPVQEVVE